MPLAVTIGSLNAPPRVAMDRLTASETGVRLVQWSANSPGMRPRDLGGSARRDLLATLRRNAMELAGIDLWIPMAHFDDPVKSARALDALLAAIEMAEDLNRVMISTALPTAETHDQNEDEPTIALRRHILETVSSEAERRGVTIADHTADRQSTPAGDETVSAMIGPGIDPAAIISAGLDPAEVVISIGTGGRLKSVRISDLTTAGTRGPLGQPNGQLDVFAYRMALAGAEYDRPVVIDTRQWQVPWEGIAATVEAWERAAVI